MNLVLHPVEVTEGVMKGCRGFVTAQHGATLIVDIDGAELPYTREQLLFIVYRKPRRTRDDKIMEWLRYGAVFALAFCLGIIYGRLA